MKRWLAFCLAMLLGIQCGLSSALTLTNATGVKDPATIRSENTIDIPVEVKWNDEDNQDGKRPSKVIVTLLENGQETDKILELNEQNNWINQFSALPIYDSNGKKFTYSVKEQKVDAYTSVVTGGIDGNVESSTGNPESDGTTGDTTPDGTEGNTTPDGTTGSTEAGGTTGDREPNNPERCTGLVITSVNEVEVDEKDNVEVDSAVLDIRGRLENFKGSEGKYKFKVSSDVIDVMSTGVTEIEVEADVDTEGNFLIKYLYTTLENKINGKISVSYDNKSHDIVVKYIPLEFTNLVIISVNGKIAKYTDYVLVDSAVLDIKGRFENFTGKAGEYTVGLRSDVIGEHVTEIEVKACVDAEGNFIIKGLKTTLEKDAFGYIFVNLANKEDGINVEYNDQSGTTEKQEPDESTGNPNPDNSVLCTGLVITSVNEVIEVQGVSTKFAKVDSAVLEIKGRLEKFQGSEGKYKFKVNSSDRIVVDEYNTEIGVGVEVEADVDAKGSFTIRDLCTTLEPNTRSELLVSYLDKHDYVIVDYAPPAVETQNDKTVDGNSRNYRLKSTNTTRNIGNLVENQKESNGFLVTYTHEIEKLIISGKTIWNDNNNQEKKRPSTITINVYDPNDQYITSKIVNGTSTDSWEWNLEALPKYKAGKLVEYTIKQSNVSDYKTTVSGSVIQGFITQNDYTVANTTWEESSEEQTLPASTTEEKPKNPTNDTKVEEKPKNPTSDAKVEEKPKKPTNDTKVEEKPKKPTNDTKVEEKPKNSTSNTKVEEKPKNPTSDINVEETTFVSNDNENKNQENMDKIYFVFSNETGEIEVRLKDYQRWVEETGNIEISFQEYKKYVLEAGHKGISFVTYNKQLLEAKKKGMSYIEYVNWVPKTGDDTRVKILVTMLVLSSIIVVKQNTKYKSRKE